MLSPPLILSEVHPKLVVLICLFIWRMVSALWEMSSSSVALSLYYSLSRISWPFRLLRLWQWTRLVCQCARLKEKGLAADTSYSARSFPNPSRDFCFVTDCINGRRRWWICFLARNSFCLFAPKPHTSIRNLFLLDVSSNIAALAIPDCWCRVGILGCEIRISPTELIFSL